MAQKEYHVDTIKCECGERGEVTFWEWENPMHHNSDFQSYYHNHKGNFRHLAGKRFKCANCEQEFRAD